MTYLESEAWFSVDGRYRYALTRIWDRARPLLAFVMLNPSKADGRDDDATIRRCVSFARKWGFGGILVVNMYAWIATDSKELGKVADPVGPENETAIQNLACLTSKIVVAWGAHGDKTRAAEIQRLLRGERLYALGTTKGGHPRHPVRLAADTPLVEWRGYQ